jgi:Arc/MetJ family transcription regulator
MELQLDIDDALIASVKRLTEIDDPQLAVLDAIKRYVRIEAGRRLIAMGGSDPTVKASPRRRSL